MYNISLVTVNQLLFILMIFEEYNMSKIIAQRGNSWHYPENTQAAIVDAYKQPYCDGVKLDIRMTKDGKLVVSNYMNLLLIAKKPLSIRHMTLQELRKVELSCDWWNHIVFFWENKLEKNPYNQANLAKLKQLKQLHSYFITLEQALDLLPDNKELIIEIKGQEEDYQNGRFEDTIYQTLKNQLCSNIGVNGYNSELCMRLKEKLPALQVGALIAKDISPLALPFDFVSINSKTLTPAILEKCYGKNDCALYIWTINRLSEYLKLFSLFDIKNIPNIITNHPQMLKFFELERQRASSVFGLTNLLERDAEEFVKKSQKERDDYRKAFTR